MPIRTFVNFGCLIGMVANQPFRIQIQFQNSKFDNHAVPIVNVISISQIPH